MLFTRPALAQDKLDGTNVDVRTILEFKVSDTRLCRLLPAGWEANPASTGPCAGANLRVAFVDQLAVYDATGKTESPIRNLIYGIPAKTAGTPEALMIVLVMSSRAGGPYGVSMKSTNVVERKTHNAADGLTTVQESWEFKADSGNTASLSVEYIRGNATREQSEIRNYSQINPEFFRIYRFEQGVDVVSGADCNSDRLRRFAFKASGEKLSPLFDGTEQLVSVTSIPWYQREIYLPGE